MIALLLIQAAVATAPPVDWTALPELPLPTQPAAFDPSGYVRHEVAAGRCHAAQDGEGAAVRSTVAVLMGGDGAVQRIVPNAIGCPTVEQFTVGYVLSLARRTDLGDSTPGWYRYTVTYRWTG